MRLTVGRFICGLIGASALLLPSIAGAQAQQRVPCTVPKRLHLQTIILDMSDNVDRVLARVHREGYAAVAKAMPNSASDVGWFIPNQLKGTDYSPAIALKAGESAADKSAFRKAILHVDEVRAARTCDQALASNHADTWALIERGNAESRAGYYALAKNDYGAAITVDPKNWGAYMGRSSVRYALGDYAGARDDAEMATEGEQGQAYALLARADEALGDDIAATQAGGRALAQLHGNVQNEGPAHFVLATAYVDLGYDHAALDEFNAAVNALPKDWYSRNGRGEVYFAIGDYEHARADFVAAEKLYLTYAGSALDLTLLDIAQDRKAEALTDAERAAKLAPGWAYTQLWVAVAQRELQQPITVTIGEAGWPRPIADAYLGRRDFAFVKPLAPDSDTFQYALQQCEIDFYHGMYLRSGDPAQFRTLMQKAIDECPPRELERSVARALLAR